MNRTPLDDFCRMHGQTMAAQLLGLTQGSLNKALRVRREIYVFETEKGFEAEEIRPFPCSRRNQKAA